jgi:uncharacterized membrane protein YeaQ/YmgE (transglycosylase-associated protein family)
MTGSSIALLVAIDRYDDQDLRQLQAPRYDLAALKGLLEDPLIGGYHVKALHNEPMHVVQEHIGELFADKVPGDRLLLYFSGHGLKSDSGELYLATTNTKLRNFTATAVSSWFVRREIEHSRSRRIILLLDCCYGGAFSRGDLVSRAGEQADVLERFQGRGRAVITASTAMQYAFELGHDRRSGQSRPSVFTSALVRGLESGEADRDSDGLISVSELYDYLYDEVRRLVPDQTPTSNINVEGELFVARSTRQATPPGPLPARIHKALGSEFPSVREGVVRDLKDLLSSGSSEAAGAAWQALERLREDDSRRVSSAAAAALDQHGTATWTRTAPPVGSEPPPQVSEAVPGLDPHGPTTSRRSVSTPPAAGQVPRRATAQPTRSPSQGGPRIPDPDSLYVTLLGDPERQDRDRLRSPEPEVGQRLRAPARRGSSWFPGMAMLIGSLALVGAAIWAIVRFQPWQGTGLGILSLVVIGVLVGAIARAILPANDPGGIIVTILIGIVGAILGGFLAQVLFNRDTLDEWFDLSTWLTGIIDSIILLVIYRLVVGRGRGNRRVI